MKIISTEGAQYELEPDPQLFEGTWRHGHEYSMVRAEGWDSPDPRAQKTVWIRDSFIEGEKPAAAPGTVPTVTLARAHYAHNWPVTSYDSVTMAAGLGTIRREHGVPLDQIEAAQFRDAMRSAAERIKEQLGRLLSAEFNSAAVDASRADWVHESATTHTVVGTVLSGIALLTGPVGVLAALGGGLYTMSQNDERVRSAGALAKAGQTLDELRAIRGRNDEIQRAVENRLTLILESKLGSGIEGRDGVRMPEDASPELTRSVRALRRQAAAAFYVRAALENLTGIMALLGRIEVPGGVSRSVLDEAFDLAQSAAQHAEARLESTRADGQALFEQIGGQEDKLPLYFEHEALHEVRRLLGAV